VVPVETATASAPQQPAEFSLEAYSARLDTAVQEGRITREQADAIKSRMENLSEEELEQLRERLQAAAAGQSGQSAPRIPIALGQDQAIQLREGLTVTVSIILQQRKNVLMVPNKVIITRGAETFVQIIQDGVTEERSVRTGLAGWLNTEIIEGLSEGEQVVIPQATTTSSSDQPRGFFMGR